MKLFNNIKKNFKTKGDYSSLLHNRFLLYFFALMAVIDLMYFASTNDVQSLITLIIIGFLTSFFNKNMIIVLLVALVVTHVLKYGTNVSREGLEDMSDDTAMAADSENSESKNIGPMDPAMDPDMKGAMDNESSVPTKPKTPQEISKEIDVDSLKATLKEDFTEFKDMQDSILGGLQKMDNILNKGESFIKKYEGYGVLKPN